MSEMIISRKMYYEQYHVKYKGLNKCYMTYTEISFSDLELSTLNIPLCSFRNVIRIVMAGFHVLKLH